MPDTSGVVSDAGKFLSNEDCGPGEVLMAGNSGTKCWFQGCERPGSAAAIRDEVGL
jgi:hypothetical protein